MPPDAHEFDAARACIKAGQLDQARRLLRAGPSRDPQALWLLAELEVTGGDIGTGLALAREAEALRTADGDQAYRLGFGLHRRGKPAEAVVWYRRAVGASPRLLDAWCNLGAALQTLGRPGEAIDAYGKALGLRPDFPEVLGNVGNAYLELGRPAEAAASLERATTLKPDLATAWNSLGIARKRQGRRDAARDAYQRASTLRPDYADAHANAGVLCHEAGEFDRAEALFRRALALGKVDVLNNLGAVLTDCGRHAEALPLLREALARSPESAEVHCNLGNALLAAGEVDAARRHLCRSLELVPGHGEAHCNLGNSHLARNELAEALACYERGEQAAPAHAEARFNQSLVHLARGDFARGWPLYEHRFAARKGGGPRTFPRSVRLERGAAVAGKTVLVHHEQGLGDTLQFVRFLPALRAAGARVRVEVQPPLVGLIAASGLADSVHGTRQAPGDHDLHCPLLSLPQVLSFDPLLQTAPSSYLVVPAGRESRIGAPLAARPGPRIGLVWAGNPRHRNDRRRSIPLRALLGAFAGFAGTLVGLQRDRTGADAALLAGVAGALDLGPAFADFADTAAAVSRLDLVVSVDTAVAHLAGALGVATWLLLPFAPDWRWMLERDDSPWYPSLRLFRQPRIGDWDSVLRDVRDALGRRGPAADSGAGRARSGTRERAKENR